MPYYNDYSEPVSKEVATRYRKEWIKTFFGTPYGMSQLAWDMTSFEHIRKFGRYWSHSAYTAICLYVHTHNEKYIDNLDIEEMWEDE